MTYQRIPSVFEGDPQLTWRERAIATSYADRWTAGEVANAYGVKQATVVTTLKRVREKYLAVGRDAGSKIELGKRLEEDARALA